MAYLGNFNAAEIEPADFSALPAGDYTALISASEFKNTKSGDGQYLVLSFQIIDGAKKGRMLWHNLNLINSNQKAVEIAQRELSAICRAVNAMQIDNSEALHDKPLRITVDYIPAGPDRNGIHRDESNRIKKFASLTAPAPATPGPATAPRPAGPPKAAPAPAPVAPPAPTAVKGKPWGPPKAVAPVPEPELEDIPF